MRIRKPFTGALLTAMAAAVVAVVAAAAAVALASPGAGKRRHHPNPCAAWSVRTLLTGQQWLEYAAFDGRGGMILSALSQQKLLRLTRTAHLTLLLNAAYPGAQVRRGKVLYFTTGDSALSPPGAGTIDKLNLRTHKHTTWARGLTNPNGLAFLPNGDAVVTHAGPGVARIPAKDRRHPQANWSTIDDTNGIAVDPGGKWLYVDRTFSSDGEVDRLLIKNPSKLQVVGRLGPQTAPDDMTIDAKGILWIAAFGAGKIFRLNPYNHRSCAIATGLQAPTAAIFGGVGWNRKHLYVTGAGGFLYELTPPR